MIGLITGLIHFSGNSGAKGIGVIINLFIGVTDTNMDQYYILVLISIFIGFIALFFLHFLPSEVEILAMQKKL